MEFLSASPKDTARLAAIFAKEVLSTPLNPKGAFVVSLSGNLGAGKTNFIKSFARGAGVAKTITSPTFLLIRRYALGGKRYKNLFHIDAYRISNPEEIKKLGICEIMNDKKNLVFVEWGEKIKKLLPPDVVLIKIRHGKKENERVFTIDAD